MMNPYKQILAFRLWFLGFWPLSALQSHLSPLYLGTSAWIHFGSCNLDLEPGYGDLCQGDDLLVSTRSFNLWLNHSRLGSSQVVRRSEMGTTWWCLVSFPRHHIFSRSSSGHTPYNILYLYSSLWLNMVQRIIFGIWSLFLFPIFFCKRSGLMIYRIQLMFNWLNYEKHKIK